MKKSEEDQIPDLNFEVFGTPMPYRRPENSYSGKGRRRHTGADNWKWAVRHACAKKIVHESLEGEFGPSCAHLGIGEGSLNKVRSGVKVRWGPKEPWFQPGVPLKLEVVIYVPRPKSHYTAKGKLRKAVPKYPVGPPDVSNYLKEIEDALGAWPATRGGKIGGAPLAYRDDAQIVRVEADKCYADIVEPGADVSISVF